MNSGPRSDYIPSDFEDGAKPVFSTEVEESVVGCLLLDARQCVPVCRDAGVEPSCFHNAPLANIYDSCLTVFDQTGTVDTVLLAEELKKRKVLDAYGGIAYISELADKVASPVSLSHYLPILTDMASRRRLMAAGREVMFKASDKDTPLPELLEFAMASVVRSEVGQNSSQLPTASELVRQVIDSTELAFKNGGVPNGLATGLEDLDRLITGMLQPGNVYFISGRPSTGKSSLAMQIAIHLSTNGVGVGVFSLEMSSESLMSRAMAHVSRVGLTDILNGSLCERDFTKLTKAAAILSKAALYIDDRGGVSITDLRARARRMVNTMGVRLLIIDYVQLVMGSDRRMDEYARVTEASAQIKHLSKQLKIPIIALVQLNRDIEKNDKPRKPRLSDLRSSGQLEQDGDLIAALWDSTSPDQRDDRNTSVMPTTLSILKQRNGPLGDVPLVFLKSIMRHEPRVIGHTEL